MIESGYSLPSSLLVLETPMLKISAPQLAIYRFAGDDNSPDDASPEELSSRLPSGWQASFLSESRHMLNNAFGVTSRIVDAHPDAVLLDARALSPLNAGYAVHDEVVELCEGVREHAALRSLPLIVLLPEGDEVRVVACAQAGVDNFFCDPLPQEVLSSRLDMIRRQRDFAPGDATDRIVLSLLCATEAKDFRLRRHAERVASYADQISETLQLPPDERMALHYGALLHDVGNIGISDSILLKPGGLSDWEFDEVRLHPIIGEQICKPLRSLADILPMVRSHHEKIDGSGYPDGLQGDEIPFLVKVLSVIDVYDTLRSDRVYRGAFGHDDALDILREEATRGWWDNEVVALLDTLLAPDKDFPLV